MAGEANAVVGTADGFDESTSNNTEDFILERYNADGSLDKSFGSNGQVLTNFGPDSFSTASGIAIAPTPADLGKTVAGFI